MYIYTNYDGRSYDVQTLKFETKEQAMEKIENDLKEYWVPYMEEVFGGEISVKDMIKKIVNEIVKKGNYNGLYGECDSFTVSLKEFE